MSSRASLCAVSLLAFSSVACSRAAFAPTVQIDSLQVKAAPPGRVFALVSVTKGDSAAEDLGKENFEVREADVTLDSAQVQLRVQPLGELRGHEAVVLVDGSRPFTANERAPLAQALAQLVDRLRFHQNVSLLAFDGSPELRSIARYPMSGVAAPLGKDPGIERLLAFRPRDKSSSLYSALVQGRKALDERLSQPAPFDKIGSLVVVARGPDRAGRTEEAAARAALSGRRSFLLKVGTWAKDESLDWVGSNGVRSAASLGTLRTPIDELARQVDDLFLRSYVVSYCSPARAGKRRLEVVVKVENESGIARQAEAASELDATGFNASCLKGGQQASTR